MSDKYAVERGSNGGCCICSRNSRDLFVMRHAETGRLAAICSSCALAHLDCYLIDNTRPWPCLCEGETADSN